MYVVRLVRRKYTGVPASVYDNFFFNLYVFAKFRKFPHRRESAAWSRRRRNVFVVEVFQHAPPAKEATPDVSEATPPPPEVDEQM